MISNSNELITKLKNFDIKYSVNKFGARMSLSSILAWQIEQVEANKLILRFEIVRIELILVVVFLNLSPDFSALPRREN